MRSRSGFQRVGIRWLVSWPQGWWPSPAAGGGIGGAVALASAAEGASVVVADYGVGLAGEDPSSEVADGWWPRSRRPAGGPRPWPTTVSTMDAGERLVQTAVDRFGRIDGVVLRGRHPARADAVQHDRGRVGRGHGDPPERATSPSSGPASAVMRKQEGRGRSSGSPQVPSPAAWPRPTTAAAKGGIVSLVRSRRGRPPPLRRSPPTPSPRWPAPACRPTSRWSWPRWASPRTWRRWSSTCFATSPGTSPGRCTPWWGARSPSGTSRSRSGPCASAGAGRPEEIAARLDSTVGQERMGLMAKLEEYPGRGASGDKPNA